MFDDERPTVEYCVNKIREALEKPDDLAYGYSFKLDVEPDVLKLELRKFLSETNWEVSYNFYVFLSTSFGPNPFNGKIDRLIQSTICLALKKDGLVTTRVEDGEDTLSDESGLNAIRNVMSGTEWSADTLDSIAAVVRMTGRSISDLNEDLNYG